MLFFLCLSFKGQPCSIPRHFEEQQKKTLLYMHPLYKEIKSTLQLLR